MEKYNYKEAMTDDIWNYLTENYTEEELKKWITERPLDFAEELNDKLWVEDSVTGNASGSYTFDTWRAEEYLCHNWNLLAEALNDFGFEGNAIEKGAEWCDVTIRCWLLAEIIDDVIQSQIACYKSIK